MVATPEQAFEKRVYEIEVELLDDLQQSGAPRRLAEYVAKLERELSLSAARELALDEDH